MSSKLLAVVDEIRGDARADQWEHSETLKQMVTAERRIVNNKYGSQVVEFNCCRFLLFSNSPAAIPLGKNDRRFEITIFECDPRPESDYGKLYGLLGNPAFINDVRVWRGRRDISRFNPGARARHSAARSGSFRRRSRRVRSTPRRLRNTGRQTSSPTRCSAR